MSLSTSCSPCTLDNVTLDALVHQNPPGSPPISRTVILDPQKAPSMPDSGLPALVLLKKSVVSLLENFCEIGTQHDGKELAGILMNRKGRHSGEKPYILLCKYKSVGTLTNAVRKFLGRVNPATESKAYFIAVEDELFQALEQQAVSEQSLCPPITTATRPAGTLNKEELLAKCFLELLAQDNEIQDDRTLRTLFRGNAYSCQLVRQRILTAAKSNQPVLIQGERGTGKEVVARAIHEFSPMKGGPFMAINCSAISPLLLEAELFGVEKDYPNKGTQKKDGLWVLAKDGTIFLDEIGDLAADHQAKILRAVQEGVVCPVGANEEIRVNARIISATNRNTEARDRQGGYHFRQDLKDRLKGIVIRTPRLNSHPEDIPEYALAIWQDVTKNQTTRLDPALIDLLVQQPWKDNVRGLRKLLWDLHSTFSKNPTVEKLQLLIQYREAVEEAAIHPENLAAPELDDIIEVLAKASHTTWYAKRAKEGWVWGATRVETAEIKTNPDMLPYEQLSEAQKSYARDEARAILRALLNERYAILK